MNRQSDPQALWFFGGVLGLLVVASLVGAVLAYSATNERSRAVVGNLNARIRAWWLMTGFFGLAVASGNVGAILLFAAMSLLALREFVTLVPSHRDDHRALFWAFFIITPAHYYFVWTEWYGFFSIFIPVYACLWIPVRNALAGDTTDYMARTARIQWALLVCVYFVGYAPALLTLRIPGFEGQNAKLLCFLVTVTQLSDVFQYVWGKTQGRHPVVPALSPNKTVEGLVGGVATAVGVGTALWWMTPFRPWQAALMALAICLMGFCGGLVMSAIKRDRGVKDFGAMIEGHGGMLDRIDSLCFAAPLFFHLVRYWYT